MRALTSLGAALLLAASSQAGVCSFPEDTIPPITPLFEPILIEDKLPFEGEPPISDLLKKGYDTSFVPTRSEAAYKIGTPATDTSVSALGAAVWSLSFDAPKGAGGMTPAVGLVYSSQSGNGNAGWGVSISGISGITRGLKTPFHDGITRGVRYDSHDALFLDGRRLLLYSGTEGAQGAVYYPEGDPYTKVRVTSANTTTGPLSFEVSTSDGHILEYGATANARLTFTDAGSVQRVHSWYVSSEDDPNGNYVEYSYMHDHLSVYPETISYGKNRHTGTGAENHIRLDYTGVYAGSLRTFVIGGVRGGVYKCLDRVRTMTGSSVYRDYLLEYNPMLDGTERKYERLTTVTCRNGTGEEMLPVTLSWNAAGEPSFTAEITDVSTDDANPIVEKQDSIFLAADLNGDGLADIVRISNCKLVYDSYNYTEKTFAYIHRSQMTDGGVSYLPPLRYELPLYFNLDDWTDIMGGNTVADIDGDGLNDLLIPYYTSISSVYRRINFSVIFGKDVRIGSTSVMTHETVLYAAEDMPPYTAGDFDGNGIDDLVCLEGDMSDAHYPLDIDLNQPNNGCSRASIPLTLLQKPKRLFAGDFNSDGLPDIIALYEGGYKMFFNNGGNTASSIFSDSNSLVGSSFGDAWRVEQGDFNGDGLADFVYVAGNSSHYHFALNNGDGTFAVSLAIDYDLHDLSTGTDDRRFTLVPLDIDRDGMTDLIVAKGDFNTSIWSDYPPSSTYVGWLISDGTSLTEIRRVTSPYLPEDAGTHNIMTGDFDGDGWPELANNGTDWYTSTNATSDGCHIRIYHSAAFTPGTGNLAAAADGLGATTSFRYATSAMPVFYTHTYGGTFPLTDHHAPVTLVSRMLRDDGLAGARPTIYRYTGLKLHRQGKGFLGFSGFSARDSLTGVTTLSGTLQWNTSHYVPSVTYSSTNMAYDNSLTSTTMSVTAMTKGGYVSFPSIIHHTDMDGNETTETCTYNTENGCPLMKKTEYGSSSMYKKTQYSDYVQAGGRWLPRTVNTTWKHTDDISPYSCVNAYTYDTAGNMLTACRYPGSAMQLTTTLTYDSYGNILSSAKSGVGVPQVTDYSVYDATGRFVTRRYQSADTGETILTYDLWGNPLTSTSAADPSNPLVTTYTYDGWGDAVSVTSPEGVTATVSMGWGGNTCTRYYRLEECPGKPWVKTWYDVRGRTAQEETRGPCGTEVVTVRTWNGWGETREVISRDGTRVTYGRNDFDYRGRPSHTYTTGQGSTYYTYGNRSQTATHDSRTYTTTSDAWGNPVEASDPQCTVTYTYGSNGLPAQVEADDGQTTSVCSMEYDIAGHRTRIDDPDAGTITCTYTPDGRILSRTDGRGIQTVNSYDTLGRLSQSVCDTLVTSYTYGTSGYGKLLVEREETNGRASEYDYDRFGRVIFDKRIYGDGFMSGHTYAYDSVGHVSHHIFPSGLTVGYSYDVNGHMMAMTCNGAQVWQAVSSDGWTSVEAFGNTTITTLVTRAGQLAERYVQHNGSTQKLHRIVLTWDSIRGNLSARTGIKGANVTESFSYDSLDRLTGVSSGGQPAMSMTYAANGNILSKTGLGAYTYSATRPHAVAGVDNTGGLITSTSQQIAYNPWGKASHIEDGTHTQDLVYGPDMQRWRVIDKTGGQETGRQYPHGNYEWRNVNGQTRQFHYLENGVIALKVGSNGFWYYHTLTDNVGSVIKVVTGEGTTAFGASYDAWGKPTVTVDDIAFPRGFGGHEMLPNYGLVNMDGRLYDYTLGRFLSPDNYVQEPDNSQSFNRYAYCLNNPLKYSDPTGELFGIDDLIIGISAFVSGYVANAISTHNWGWVSFQNGLISAGMSLIGWHTGNMSSSVWSIASNIATSNIVNAFMPTLTLPIDQHFSLSFSPIFGFGTDGLSAGLYGSVNYINGKNAFSIGGGFGKGYAGWRVYAKSGNWGAGYGRTYYSEGNFNGNYLGPQEIGTLTLSFLDTSLDYSNDYFGDGDDRWRTTAAELTIGKFSVGSYVYGNHGGKESGWEGEKWKDEKVKEKYSRGTKIPLVGKMDAWNKGTAYYAPFWLGYSHQGNIYRIGMSGKIVHRLTQNLFHKIISFPAYDNYANTIDYGYSYYGRHNPLSIW